MESLDQWLSEQGLGTRLRGLRAQAGLSGKQLADAAGWAQSKVSRIENGPQRASAEDIRAWVRITGASDEVLSELLEAQKAAEVYSTTFSDRMRHGQLSVQETYTKLAREASLIRYFQTAFVPGPLQIPDYARRIFTEMYELHQPEVQDIDKAVAERMERQQFLYDPSKRWEFIITEPVLRFRLPSVPVMRMQLDRLQTVTGLDNVRFGVIPLDAGLKWSPQNAVEIYVSDKVVAIDETFIGEKFRYDEEAAKYQRVLDLLWEEAVEGEEARELIMRAVRALPD